MIQPIPKILVWGEVGDYPASQSLPSCLSPFGVMLMLFLGRQIRAAQPVFVLRFDFQSPNHPHLHAQSHLPRPPVLPNPLAPRDPIAEQGQAQKHGTLGSQTRAVNLLGASSEGQQRRRGAAPSPAPPRLPAPLPRGKGPAAAANTPEPPRRFRGAVGRLPRPEGEETPRPHSPPGPGPTASKTPHGTR